MGFVIIAIYDPEDYRIVDGCTKYKIANAGCRVISSILYRLPRSSAKLLIGVVLVIVVGQLPRYIGLT
jgi:hypothetical protein